MMPWPEDEWEQQEGDEGSTADGKFVMYSMCLYHSRDSVSGNRVFSRTAGINTHSAWIHIQHEHI